MTELKYLRRALAPRFDLERQIGAGGAARVYLAWQRRPLRQVAIKVLRAEVSATIQRDRFQREVDICSQMSHPYVVPILSVGDIDGLPYYVMPYVPGESLRHRIDRPPPLSLDEIVHVISDVADGLAYAHGQGIIHRDIKPGNILLSGGHGIVADFGIARPSCGSVSVTASGMAVGSLGYMSPEQALGASNVDARTDVYSLGCVLFEMLMGAPPTLSFSPVLTEERAGLESCPALAGVEPSSLLTIADVLRRSLAPIADERLSSAGEFLRLLNEPAPLGVGLP